jgi:hypothetical protein
MDALNNEMDRPGPDGNLKRGIAFALLPGFGTWALIIWLLWRFWPN